MHCWLWVWEHFVILAFAAVSVFAASAVVSVFAASAVVSVFAAAPATPVVAASWVASQLTSLGTAVRMISSLRMRN